MPVGEVLLALFIGWQVWPAVRDELAQGGMPGWLRAMKGFVRYAAPELILTILVRSA
jgi:NSS family neurotransmitter:Na+ symporter